MKTLVLFSGGLKSMYLAEVARREGPATLLFYNIQTAHGPAPAPAPTIVSPLAKLLGLNLHIKYLNTCPPLHDALLRLLFFLLHALPIARQEGCRLIYHGLSKDDEPLVAPLVELFMKQFQATFMLSQPLYDGRGGWLGCVEFETPLRRLRREHVVRLGNEYRIPWELTYSCDRPGTIHCGSCNACKRRRRAFKQEGSADPTLYQDIDGDSDSDD